MHRCLQRHGIGRLPDVEGDRPAKKKFKSYPIGYFHIDIAEVGTEQGKLHMFVAIDRTSKCAFVELHEKATTAISREFLLRLLASISYKTHTVLTDNGVQFTTPGAGGSAVPLIKDATVKRFYYESHDQLRQHLADFAAAYNFARRLKTLKSLTPYEFICQRCTKEPERFRLNPVHQNTD
ncbi:transposase-like protein [Aquamicrobium ahrensii]|uniref:Transposase-like protein n=1 Tax=Aquamicrobium ahrensii TaxID=469551 RepID=A0ABV2KRV6_9HYPH